MLWQGLGSLNQVIAPPQSWLNDRSIEAHKQDGAKPSIQPPLSCQTHNQLRQQIQPLCTVGPTTLFGAPLNTSGEQIRTVPRPVRLPQPAGAAGHPAAGSNSPCGGAVARPSQNARNDAKSKIIYVEFCCQYRNSDPLSFGKQTLLRYQPMVAKLANFPHGPRLRYRF